MRVFVPSTLDDLRHLLDESRLAAPLEAFALTAAVRDELGDLSDEEAEYALTTAAAESSHATLAGGVEGERHGRRVVVVAEVEVAAFGADGDIPGVVRLTSDVSLPQVVAVLADPDEVDLTHAPADDLAWYATQELPGLLA